MFEEITTTTGVLLLLLVGSVLFAIYAVYAWQQDKEYAAIGRSVYHTVRQGFESIGGSVSGTRVKSPVPVEGLGKTFPVADFSERVIRESFLDNADVAEEDTAAPSGGYYHEDEPPQQDYQPQHPPIDPRGSAMSRPVHPVQTPHPSQTPQPSQTPIPPQLPAPTPSSPNVPMGGSVQGGGERELPDELKPIKVSSSDASPAMNTTYSPSL